ncbi:MULTISPECIES: DUF6404 family protein [Vibrio]|uniref:DUF6404 family protein n=1 Tax=Vibrio TaxID=662 RepID=UPI0005F1068B|nr:MULTISPECIES: DUF6404 family protein [Vibrio]MBN8105536.1 magnesium transporter [Vibrio vulnificus]MDG2669889.1 DUF6404 family protein [Vibrio parahaemolyticus]HAS8547694.1 magnesium transporter [Vibrio vulnificus]
MENRELIQQRLIEQGVPRDLAKFNFNFLSKLALLEEKPLVFQSPSKVFFVQGLVTGVTWGFLMWVMIWHSAPEDWVVHVISTLAFGSFMGGFWSYRIAKHQKKLGNVTWSEWYRAHGESAP